MSNLLPNASEKLKNNVVSVACPKAVFWDVNLWIIVLPDNSMHSIEDATKLLNPLFHTHKTDKFVIFNHSQFISEIKKGNFFICVSCSKENLIYDPERLLIPSLELSKRHEILSQVTAQFYFGLGRSGAFSEGAAFHFANRELPIAMFMLHQATELLQRGLLLSLTNQNLRSHSINEFNNKIRKCMPKLVFLEDDGSEDKYLIERLEYAYSSARYNIAYEVPEEHVWQLFEKLRTYTNVAMQTFNEKVSLFKNAYPINK